MSETILVITGDAAGSTKSGLAASRDLLAAAFRQAGESFPETRTAGAFQIIRGDGFQGAFGSVSRGLRCALFFHAYFRSVRTHPGNPPGVRTGLGVGPWPIEAGGVLASTGEAFVLSGRVLDSMKETRDDGERPARDFRLGGPAPAARTDGLTDAPRSGGPL